IENATPLRRRAFATGDQPCRDQPVAFRRARSVRPSCHFPGRTVGRLRGAAWEGSTTTLPETAGRPRGGASRGHRRSESAVLLSGWAVGGLLRPRFDEWWFHAENPCLRRTARRHLLRGDCRGRVLGNRGRDCVFPAVGGGVDACFLLGRRTATPDQAN